MEKKNEKPIKTADFAKQAAKKFHGFCVLLGTAALMGVILGAEAQIAFMSGSPKKSRNLCYEFYR